MDFYKKKTLNELLKQKQTLTANIERYQDQIVLIEEELTNLKGKEMAVIEVVAKMQQHPSLQNEKTSTIKTHIYSLVRFGVLKPQNGLIPEQEVIDFLNNGASITITPNMLKSSHQKKAKQK
jgi:hypothetical protein